MKSKLSLLTAPLLGIAITLISVGASSPKKQTWEYQTVVLSDTMYQAKGVAKELNRLAAEGWEVAAFNPDPRNPTNEWFFVLKRAKE